MLPCHGGGGDDAVDGVEQGVERLRVLGEQVGQPGPDLPGGDVGAHRPVRQRRPVGGHPVDDGVAQPAELVGIEVGHSRSLGVVRLPLEKGAV